jgi:hypothetical protein
VVCSDPEPARFVPIAFRSVRTPRACLAPHDTAKGIDRSSELSNVVERGHFNTPAVRGLECHWNVTHES